MNTQTKEQNVSICTTHVKIYLASSTIQIQLNPTMKCQYYPTHRKKINPVTMASK